MVDDSVEEHKLLSQNHEKARLKELAGDEWEEDEGGGADEEPLTVAQLRETIKIEKDQKVHYHLYNYMQIPWWARTACRQDVVGTNRKLTEPLDHMTQRLN